jgi:hypothetical protein
MGTLTQQGALHSSACWGLDLHNSLVWYLLLASGLLHHQRRCAYCTAMAVVGLLRIAK